MWGEKVSAARAAAGNEGCKSARQNRRSAGLATPPLSRVVYLAVGVVLFQVVQNDVFPVGAVADQTWEGQAGGWVRRAWPCWRSVFVVVSVPPLGRQQHARPVSVGVPRSESGFSGVPTLPSFRERR